jgi:hypothetical protein
MFTMKGSSIQHQVSITRLFISSFRVKHEICELLRFFSHLLETEIEIWPEVPCFDDVTEAFKCANTRQRIRYSLIPLVF